METNNYLPRENSSAVLPKKVLEVLWSSKVINAAIGARNDTVARDWFISHPETRVLFEQGERELLAKIKEVRERTDAALRAIAMGDLVASFDVKMIKEEE